jgi:hypothetical protein
MWMWITLPLLLLLLHLAGGRAAMGVLSGTRSDVHLALPVAYLLAWLGTILVAPVLLLAHGIMFAWTRWRS